MRHLRIDSPARIDIAGGTLDIWPLSSMIKNATTVNCTLNKGIVVEWEKTSGPVELVNKASDKIHAYPSTHPDVALFSKALSSVNTFNLKDFRLVVKSELPKGSGLGLSSVITATIIYGTYLFHGLNPDKKNIVRMSADIEAEYLKYPTGIQDYIAPLYGGLSSIKFPYGDFDVIKHEFFSELSNDIMLVYTGISHFSASPNWEMLKLAIENPEKYLDRFQEINRIALEAEKAIEVQDMDSLAALAKEDFDIRQNLPVKLIPYHPMLFSLLERCHKIPGFRMCGAAGGGTVAVFCKPGLREEVAETFQDHGLLVLENLFPEDRGMRIES